ncbi:MAG: glycosyl transferase, partial [Planctomycetota bacterium]
MIFVTVGSQLPFDRLVHAVDAWAEAAGRADEVFAQVGATSAPPRSVGWAKELSPEAFQRRVDEADVVVRHPTRQNHD